MLRRLGRLGAALALLVLLGASLLVGFPAVAFEVPPAGNVFAIQTNGPNGAVTLGDWYTSTTAGAGSGHHYLQFWIPCGWPSGTPVLVDLFSPEMNRVSGALAQDEEPNGNYDSTQFELYGPGASVGPGFSQPSPGTGIAGTRVTYQPGAPAVSEAWVRYATIAAPVACGAYVLRSQVLANDPLNPGGTGDDQNGWRLRVGADDDADPTDAPPANSDDWDGVPGTNDEIAVGVAQVTFQQGSGGVLCQTFYQYVDPGQASVTFNNFDMDGNTRVRYYAPGDPSYDPSANSGGTIGTLSTNGAWNGGTLATRVGDTIANPATGWWRIVNCLSSNNQLIQEGQTGRPLFYAQPPTPALAVSKSDGTPTISPGQSVTYTIDVTNTAVGPTAGAATGVVVIDTLPAELTYQSCAVPVPAQGTWSCSEAAGVVTFTQTGWIDAGAEAQLTITATVNQGATGSKTNTVTADYTDQLGNPYPQVVGADTDTISAVADLRITKTDGIAAVVPGTSTTYTITVTNDGPAIVPAGVVISDAIPVGTTGSESASDCTITVGVFACTTSAALPPGGSVSYQLTVAVPTGFAQATLVNTATIASSPVADPNPANDSATDTDTISASADLQIAKTDAPDPAAIGAPLVYTLTITNSGPSDAATVTVTDVLPAGVTFGSAAPSQGSCSQASGTVTCALGTLPASATATISITVTPTAAGTLTNTSSVSSPTPDPVPGNNSDVEPTTVGSVSADLAIAKTDGVTTVTAGTSTTYAVTLTNAGPATVPAGVTISDPVPTGTTGTESAPDCVISAGVFVCTTSAPLPAGASVTYSLTVDVPPGYVPVTLVNTATVVSSPVADPNPANDSATDTDTIAAGPAQVDVRIDKSDSADPVGPGEGFSYSLVITNDGPDDAVDVTVTDPVPAALDVTGASGAPGSCSTTAGLVTCALPSLAAGASWTIMVDVRVPDAAVPGSVVNMAAVSAAGDTDASNDSAVESTTIADDPGTADLSIAKTVDDASPSEGETVVYTITVSNAGPEDATGVVVGDLLPDGLEFVSADESQGSYDEGSGDWDLGTLGANERATLELRARVDRGTGGTAIINTASVEALDQADLEGDDDSDTAVVEVADEDEGGGNGGGNSGDPLTTAAETASTGFSALWAMWSMLMLGLSGAGAIALSRRR